MNAPNRYICLDCKNAPRVSDNGKVFVQLVSTSDKQARAHVRRYNHRVGAINKNGRVVFVYFLDEKNKLKDASFRGVPPF